MRLFGSDTSAIVGAIGAAKRQRALRQSRAAAARPAASAPPTSPVSPVAPVRARKPKYPGVKLVETTRPVVKARSVPAGFVVLTIHAAVIGSVVYQAGATAGGQDRVPHDTPVVFIDAPTRQPEPEKPATITKPQAPEAPRPEVPPPVVPPVVAPEQVPSVIPPVDSGAQLPPVGESAVGVESGIAAGTAVDSAAAMGSYAYDAESVEQRPVLRSPGPTYPAILDQLGIEGRVVLVAIIDTNGRVEPSSLAILESSHPGFEEPTRRWALKARFRPGRMRGHPVRVMVRLPITYRPGQRRW